MNASTNPTALQSKQWIYEALFTLMSIKPYNSITISELTKKADLSRRTFYRNFDSKDDVLQYYLSKIVDEYTKRLLQYRTYTLEFSIELLLNLCRDHQHNLLILRDNHMLGLLLENWTRALPQVHNTVLNHLQDFPEFNDQEALEYLLAFNVGGTFNVMLKWINDGMVLSEKEVAHTLFHYTCQLSARN